MAMMTVPGAVGNKDYYQANGRCGQISFVSQIGKNPENNIQQGALNLLLASSVEVQL